MALERKTSILLLVSLLGAGGLAFASLARTLPASEKTAKTSSPGGLPEVPPGERTAVASDRILNDEAPVPPQCYTKTDGRHNPCYTCHQTYDPKGSPRLNPQNDGANQGVYTFSDVGLKNHFSNLFVDRRPWLDLVSDETIQSYVNTDNYAGLAERLKAKKFQGFVPDLAGYAEGARAFDEHGLARDGSAWVAFNYKPFLGTFWPTNGSTDDVLVRLPKAFRELNGTFYKDAYYVNLTLVELNLKDRDEGSLWPIDERALGTDVDGDGKLGVASVVKRLRHYVGDASGFELSFQQFPVDSELMHSVRYLGVDEGGHTFVPKRMKELRYMRKVNVMTVDLLESRYANERKEKRLGQLPNFLSRGDAGFDNGLGWYVQGFLEDYSGELRPQSHEEGLYCMGCHAALGTTIDNTFSMARKVPGAAGWSYVNFRGMRDAATVSEPGGEILNYLKRAGGGSEFRENTEMRERWFRADGTVDEEEVAAADVYTLVTPSAQRANDLNKAYAHIVRHQSFIFGRDATWLPANNVHRNIDEKSAPLEESFRHFGWDLRLAW